MKNVLFIKKNLFIVFLRLSLSLRQFVALSGYHKIFIFTNAKNFLMDKNIFPQTLNVLLNHLLIALQARMQLPPSIINIGSYFTFSRVFKPTKIE